MAEAQIEQRATRRFNLRLPVAVKFAGEDDLEVQAQTRDVSARGVYFYMDKTLATGSPIEFTLTLPPEITLTDSIHVRCTGRVVRVSQEGNRVGIAAAIEQYDFVPEK
jgi:hypothetical protein